MRQLPWVIAALALALLVSGLALTGIEEHGQDALVTSLGLTFAGVGALIASRHPGNAMGWLLLGIGVATGFGSVAAAYADYWVAGGWGPVALGETAAWYANLSWIPFILVPCTFVPLLFPDGRLLSTRWRWVAWCAGAGIVAVFVADGVYPGPIDDFPQIENPYGIDMKAAEPLGALAYLVMLVAIVGSCASLVIRFRRAHGERRQQIKWLALAGVVAAVVVPAASAGFWLWGPTVTNVASMIAITSLPLAVGVAILRHRLYDIDLVIRRTLVYGVLTATLGGAYLGLVVLAGLAVGRSSDLAIAAATLTVAALFRPARGRIQALVDRRFYRRRYDATQTLEAFAGRLRDEIDLEHLVVDLHDVVRETVQPAQVSVWLKKGAVVTGEDAMVTVLFADIRDFTPFADRVTAREAVALLNEFFGVVVPVLEDHGGRVDKYLGDGMLGVFGAPHALPDHADRGVAAARAIAAAVDEHFGERCRVSVGVNTGLVLVGTIGGGSRFELGIIGDPVNVAARVEQATRATGDVVLLTEATRCMLADTDGLVRRGPIGLKGKTAPVTVYALATPVAGHLKATR